MFDDIIKSIKASLYDRVTSPLSSALIISWFVWNYQVVFVLFSSMPVSERFKYIETVFYGEKWASLGELAWLYVGIIFPFITAVIILIVYPWPAKWAYHYWHWMQAKLRKLKQQIDNERLLTVEESRVIQRQVFSLQEEYDKVVNRKNSEIELLKSDIASLTEQINTYESNDDILEKRKKIREQEQDKSKQENSDRYNKESESKILNTLRFIYKYGDPTFMENVVGHLARKYSEDEATNLLLELQIKGYVSIIVRREGQHMIGLTDKGKELLEQKGL